MLWDLLESVDQEVVIYGEGGMKSVCRWVGQGNPRAGQLAGILGILDISKIP